MGLAQDKVYSTYFIVLLAQANISTVPVNKRSISRVG